MSMLVLFEKPPDNYPLLKTIMVFAFVEQETQSCSIDPVVVEIEMTLYSTIDSPDLTCSEDCS